MPLLRVTNLVAYRGGHALFAPVTFSVELGECLRITGGNGAGKTTLLDCIAGLYSDWKGNIQKPVGQVSYFQQASQYVRTLSLANVSRLVCGFNEVRYNYLTNSLGLRDHQQYFLSLLSGGELQRALLLLALLRTHTVLLLDEPFANIDKESCQAIAAELGRTKGNRATVIVTHPYDGRGRVEECLEYALCTNQCRV